MEWADKKAGDWPEEIAAEFAKVAADCLQSKPRKRADSGTLVGSC